MPSVWGTLAAAAAASWILARVAWGEENAPAEEAAPSLLRPKVSVTTLVLHNTSPFFSGESKTWAEAFTRFGLGLDEGRFAFAFTGLANRTFGTDPYGSRSDIVFRGPGSGSGDSPHVELDEGWVRLPLPFELPGTVTVGRQILQIGTQFMFGDGVYDGFAPDARETMYSNPRRTFDAARVDLSLLGADVIAFGYRQDRTWDAANRDDTRVYGLDVTRHFPSIDGTYSIGAFHRDSKHFDDSTFAIWNVRGEQRFSMLPGAYVSGEYVRENFGTCRNFYYCVEVGRELDEEAWHAEVGWIGETLPFSPFFEVGYVYYSPSFHSFAYGASDWGKWYLGNQLPWIIGGWNTKIVRLDVGVWPTETTRFRYQYFQTREVHKKGENDGGPLSDEMQWILEWYPNDWFFVNFVVAYSIPGQALEDAALPNLFQLFYEDAVPVGTKSSVDTVLIVGVTY
jgi:hypothetical protein